MLPEAALYTSTAPAGTGRPSTGMQTAASAAPSTEHDKHINGSLQVMEGRSYLYTPWNHFFPLELYQKVFRKVDTSILLREQIYRPAPRDPCHPPNGFINTN